MRNAWREVTFFLSRFLSPAVRAILIANVIVFLVFTLVTPFSERAMVGFLLLAQTPSLAVGHAFLWQFVTYMFLHANLFHLLGNMLVLWFFAPRLEYRWGTAAFLRFYFVVGVGAGLFHTAAAYLSGNPGSPMLGASGAMYGIMLAYALYWPDDVVLLYFVFPIKIKYLMIFIGVFTFFASISGEVAAAGGSNISHVTHLGGLIVAFLYLKAGTWFGQGGRGRKPAGIHSFPGSHPDFH
jgi:membrane associated rhomboid family serine protease